MEEVFVEPKLIYLLVDTSSGVVPRYTCDNSSEKTSNKLPAVRSLNKLLAGAGDCPE